MNCPVCGRELERGWLLCQPPVLWSEKPEKLSTLLTANFLTAGQDVRIKMDETGRPPAWICRNCRRVIMEY